MAPPVPDPLLEHLLGQRYLIRERIAHGGMATVYRAVDTRLERPVALKVLHPHLSEDPTFVARLSREAKAAAQLSHPHVVGVLDHGEQEKDGRTLAYLVMEYVPGSTLRQVLNATGTLPLHQSLDILDSLLEGLGAAHERGIVHRDMKPENVLIGHDGRLRVADFGLARAAMTTTGTGALLGTVAYMCPERVLGRPARPASDIYSVGIVMYELLTGERPFEGDDAIHVAYQHVNSTVPAPGHLVPDLPADYDELVGWCTDPDPERRPQNAHALLGELRHIRTQQTGTDRPLPTPLPSAAPPSLAEQSEGTPTTVLGSEGQATQVIPATSTEALGAALTRQWDRTAPGVQASETAPPHFRPHSRRWGWLWFLLVLSLIVAAASAGWYFGSGPGALGTIPDTHGMTREQAVTALTQAGFSATLERVNDDTVPADRVVSSLPPPQTSQPKSVTVLLRVSEGPILYSVPDVIGRSRQAAQQAIGDAHLQMEERTEHSESVPEGQVISQEPAPQQKKTSNSPVRVVISLGPDVREVPAVMGSSLEKATATLEGAGFVVKVNRPLGIGFTGRVIDQDMKPGRKLPPGSIITLTVL